MMWRLISILLLVVLLNGCAGGGLTDFSYVAPDAKTGYFKTFQQVKPTEILIDKPVDLKKYRQLLVVGVRHPYLKRVSSSLTVGLSSDSAPQNFENSPVELETSFWCASLQSLGYFNAVIPVENLGGFLKVNDPHYRGPLTTMTPEDVLAAEKAYGKFLLVDIAQYGLAPSHQRVVFKVWDPASGKIYFLVDRQQVIFVDFSQQLYYPILNAYKQWVQKNS